MFKDKDKQRQAVKESMRRKRQGITKGITRAESPRVSQGVTPDIIDKLTSPYWRPRLERLCVAFSGSPYAKEVRVGVYGPSLEVVSELLDVTEGVPPAKSVTGVPEMAKVLPWWTINSIKAALHNRALKGLHDDSADRWQRAVSYYEWDVAGRPVYG